MTDAPVQQRPMKPMGQCSRCGAPLPADLAVALCPQCELRGALHPLAEPSGLFGSGPFADELPTSEIPGVFSPKRLADYELLEEVARGGMGIVYRARQVSLDRIVAVKTLLAGPLASKDFVHRFRTEAAAAASLHHPNIVAIHEVGFAEGQHFFAMDYVEGLTLAQLVAKGPLPPRQAAKYLQTIAEAIHFAHERNVLHRDLKPSNVIIDSATDQPRVTDFGLAKRLAAETDLTLSGQVLGSPNFMSPEQAAAKRGTVGRRSDVYSLGALLYHLLTGRAPFQGDTLTDVLHQVMNNDPLAPHLLTPRLPRDLETICLKCLEKEPARRYQTAQELADELGRFLKDEPILARPIGLTGKAWRWCRRKPVVAGLTATSVALLLAVAIGAPIMAYRTNRARLDAQRNLYASDMRLASEEVRQGAFDHARDLLTKHIPKEGDEDLRGVEWRYLANEVQASEPVRILEGLPAPSGWAQTLLFRSDHFLYNLSGDQLKAWDMTTWEPVPLVPPAQPASVRWQWDPAHGSAYAVAQAQRSLAVYRLPKFELVSTVRLPGPIPLVPLIRMSDSHETLAVGFQESTAHRILLWDLRRDAEFGALGDFKTEITVLAFSRDGTRLAASSTNGVIGVWDLKTLEPIGAPLRSTNRVFQLEFTPDKKRLVSPVYGKRPSVWDLRSNKPSAVGFLGEVDRDWVNWFGLSPDGRYFVGNWLAYDYELTLFDSRTLQVKGMLRGHRGATFHIAFSPDGNLMASASDDQTARLWDLASHREVGVVGGFSEGVYGVAFSANGQSVALIGGLGQIRIYRLSIVLRRGLFAKTTEVEGFSRLALSPDNRLLATISVEGTLALWDRQGRSLIRSNSFPRYTLKSYPNLAFSPDGERVAWVTGDALRILSVASGEINERHIDGNREVNSIAFSPVSGELVFGCGKQLMIHELATGDLQPFNSTDDEVFAVAYSPDGTRVVFGDRRGSVTLCERATGRVLSKELKAHQPQVHHVTLSPDGRLLATCGADSTIKLWRVLPDGRLQTPPTTLRGHKDYVNHLAFSPDGTRLVSSASDQTLKIWDPHRAAELAALYGHSGMSGLVQFTTNGGMIYSSGFDGEIHVWEAPPLAEIDLSPRSAPAQTGPTKATEPE